MAISVPENQNQQGLAQRLHKHEDGRNVNQTWRSQNLISSDKSREIKPKFNETFVDYPQEPKVYPGERIPTIPDDSVPENQNQPEFKMPDYKKSMAWFERCCNDRVVEADKFVEDHQAAQSIPSIRLNQGKGMIPRLEERFSKLEKRWDDVMDKFEGAEYDELEKRVMDMRSRVKKCKEKLTKVLGSTVHWRVQICHKCPSVVYGIIR